MCDEFDKCFRKEKNMSTIKLSHGVTVRTYPVPPDSFDLAKASNRERIRYGIPRCPVEFPELAKRWEAKLRGRRFKIVEPVFRPMDYKRHHLIKVNSLRVFTGLKQVVDQLGNICLVLC
jgi:hypothetical protein